MSDERHEGQREFDLLDRVDLLIATLPPGDALRRELLDLRMEISQREEIFIEARQTIEKLEEVIKKVTSPANRIGTFLGNVGKETAHIVVGGADYYCNVDPRIPMAKLKKGTRVLVNEAFVIVGDLGFEPAGPVTKVTEVIGTERLRVGNEHGTQSLGLQRSPQLARIARESGRKRRPRIFHAREGPGDFEHVGRRIGADGARDFRDRARETPGRVYAVPVYRRSGKHPRNAARLALFQHSLDPGADVLLGDGRHRFTKRCRHHSRFESR